MLYFCGVAKNLQCSPHATRPNSSRIKQEKLMDNLVAKDWRELSKAASQERDSEKLMQLIEQLNDALDKLEHRRNALGSRAA
jgi:hypothetical protein